MFVPSNIVAGPLSFERENFGWLRKRHLNSDVEAVILSLLSTADLAKLSLVSKAARTAAEPYLYTQLDWAWTGATPPPIVPFIRTILERPHLATFVKRLTLTEDRACLRKGQLTMPVFMPQIQPESDAQRYSTSCRCRICFEDPSKHQQRPPQLQVDRFEPVSAAGLLRATGVPHWNDWLQALIVGDFDAFLALLLSRLCNLRDLYIDAYLNQGRRFVSLMLRSALLRENETDLPRFDRIRCISYMQYCDFRLDECIRDRVHHFTQLFHLPSIQYLSISLDHARHIDWLIGRNPSFNTITHLEISDVRERHLLALLSAVPKLRSLHWALYHRSCWESPLVCLSTINTALEKISETLENLTISALNDCGSDLWEEPLTFEGSLVSLHKLHRLRSLEVPYAFLASGFYPIPQVDAGIVIPLHINHLTLTCDLFEQEWGDESNGLWEDDHPRDDELLAEWMTCWLQSMDRGASQICKIFILYPWRWEDKILDMWTPGEEEHWNVVKELTADLGIQLAFRKPLCDEGRRAAFRRFNDFCGQIRS